MAPQKIDLYAHSLSDATWMTPCGGNDDSDGDEESCVAFTRIPGGLAIRDTKNPDVGTLRFTDAELAAFAAYLAEREL